MNLSSFIFMTRRRGSAPGCVSPMARLNGAYSSGGQGAPGQVLSSSSVYKGRGGPGVASCQEFRELFL